MDNRPNPAAGWPFYLQMAAMVRHAVETGELEDGERLAGVREMAAELGTSPNTVVKAYKELERVGVLELRQGSGAYVRAKGSGKKRVARMELMKDAARDVRRVIERLQEKGLDGEEMRRLFEVKLMEMENRVEE